MKLQKFTHIVSIVFLTSLLTPLNYAQNNTSGYLFAGIRSTFNVFSSDGTGLGSGGQLRLQLSERVNTEWYADYISINVQNILRSIYYHIGWSVLYYYLNKPTKLQPYILAGHCFDYNRKTVIHNPEITRSRWGSAVQIGTGSHLNLSQYTDLSLTIQYMIHLTKELDYQRQNGTITIIEHSHAFLEGHLLITLSINYKLFRIWQKN